MQIIPTVFEKYFEKAEGRIKKVRETSRWIQVDVLDNTFAFGKTFELELLNSVENNEEILWDIHLMVKEPIKWLEKCLFVGASRVIGQVEMMADREQFVAKAKAEGLEVGLGFDVDTEISSIPKETDLILLMARKAGFEEKSIDERVWKKIEKAKSMGKMVAIDGGITAENIQAFEKAGVEAVYCGSHYGEVIHANQ